MHNSYGENLKLQINGGSHDPEIELILEGIPKGIELNEAELQSFMQRRAPGQNAWSTPRKEKDAPIFKSGVEDYVTTGDKIVAVIRSSDQHSSDYSWIYDTPRPGHADYPALMKYHGEVDLRGGGHFSGRLTSLMCVAGYICKTYLKTKNVFVGAHLLQVGTAKDIPFDSMNVSTKEFEDVAHASFPTLDEEKGQQMQQVIADAKTKHDSVGGVIEVAATGLPVGLGEHMFSGVEGRVSSIMYAIPAVKGVEFGDGFAVGEMLGSSNNDPYETDGKTVSTKSNHSGGILGGMTTGMPLICRVAMKPTPSIAKEQETVSLKTMTNTTLVCPGRHDPCVVPRAVPVVEAALAIALTDLYLDD